MYKVIIADDEKNIRESLKKYIHMLSLNFEVVATFNDGEDAIEYLKCNDVDIVVTDIEMGLVSGIEVAKYVSENKKQTKTIIISGHENFNYAKKAIEYNVKNYLLKPTKLVDIKQTFTIIKQQLDTEKEEEKQNEKHAELLSITKSQLLSDIVSGIYSDKQELKDKLNDLRINSIYENKACCIVTIALKNVEKALETVWKHGRERLYLAIINHIESKDEYEIKQVYRLKGQIKVIFISRIDDEESEFNRKIEEFLKHITIEVKQTFCVELDYLRGRYFKDIFQMGKQSGILFEFDTEGYDEFNEVCKIILSCIGEGTYEQGARLLNKYLLKNECKGLEQLKYQALSMLYIIKHKTVENQSRIKDMRSYLVEIDSNIIFNLKDIDRLSEYTYKIITELTKQTNESIIGDDIIEKAKNFIQSNIEKDFSLDEVAEHVYLSANYLSRIFKEKTGETFSDYLINIKMNKAIEMLFSNKYKVYEIASLLGYSTSNSFIRTFKRHTGYSPKDYSRKLFIS